MKRKSINFFVVLLFGMLVFFQSSQAQELPSLRPEEGRMILRLDLSQAQKRSDEKLQEMNMPPLPLDSLRQKRVPAAYATQGWVISKAENGFVELALQMEQLGNLTDVSANEISKDQQYSSTFAPYAPFGYNRFKAKPTVQYIADKKVHRFLYKGKGKPVQVLLTGSFMKWDPRGIAMQNTDSGWVAELPLAEGKHLYKFIVDGKWVNDLQNLQREEDTYHGYNSVYFACNYTFHLNGFSLANRVALCGSFNEWDENSLLMKKTSKGCELPVYLAEGTYTYKFLVDSKVWLTDPTNQLRRDDGNGNLNSVLSLGNPTLFFLPGNLQAQRVNLGLEANGWNYEELKMSKVDSGWIIRYVLAPGNYQYKFVVDGNWILDPQNEVLSALNGHTNNLKAVAANHVFQLSGYADAKEVYVTGSFSQWLEPGYKLLLKDGAWQLPVRLPKGKQTYKFVVDGKWITDPANPLFEENEYGTGNSFIWME